MAQRAREGSVVHRVPSWWLPVCLGVVAALLGIRSAFSATTPPPETIDRVLRKHAPAVLQDIRKHGYRNVGVLRFHVKKGDEPESDAVGLINQGLATRLELALILANDLRNPV